MAKGIWSLVAGDKRRDDFMRRKGEEPTLDLDFRPVFRKKIYVK